MDCDKLFFEEKGPQLLEEVGMTKAEFARKMGILKQNVNSLFKTKNIGTLRKASQILGVPFELLISYTKMPDMESLTHVPNPNEEIPQDVIITKLDITPKAKQLLETIRHAHLSKQEILWIKYNL